MRVCEPRQVCSLMIAHLRAHIWRAEEQRTQQLHVRGDARHDVGVSDAGGDREAAHGLLAAEAGLGTQPRLQRAHVHVHDLGEL